MVSLRPSFSEAIAIWLVHTVNVMGRGLNGLNACSGVASARNNSRTNALNSFHRNGERLHGTLNGFYGTKRNDLEG